MASTTVVSVLTTVDHHLQLQLTTTGEALAKDVVVENLQVANGTTSSWR